MADELDSGSSVGNYVWVQVPSPAYKIRSIDSQESILLCCFLLQTNNFSSFYSTVTTFARFLGLSTSNPLSEDT